MNLPSQVTSFLLRSLLIGGIVIPLSGAAQAQSYFENNQPLRFETGLNYDYQRCQNLAYRNLPNTIRENGRDFNLKSGVYQGLRTINANGVEIDGRSYRSGCGTVLDGDVVIRGNNVELRDVVIRGDVTVLGRNASLRNVIITGALDVQSNQFRRQSVYTDQRYGNSDVRGIWEYVVLTVLRNNLR